MELFDAYPDKKDAMIKLYTNMEPYLNKLLVQGSNVELPLKSIDGVMVDFKLCACKHFHEDDQLNEPQLAVFIECARTTQVLFHKHFNTIPDFIVWLSTSYFSLSYNKLEDNFNYLENNDRLDYNILKYFPENEKVKMDFEECCVCLSCTKATLPCNHFLCKQCEGSIKIPKCPICREYYNDMSDDE
tara:strand:+ start:3584 stop:4144 length:561 start_codon:yes stop_codon:yes gene_type:complete